MIMKILQRMPISSLSRPVPDNFFDACSKSRKAQEMSQWFNTPPNDQKVPWTKINRSQAEHRAILMVKEKEGFNDQRR